MKTHVTSILSQEHNLSWTFIDLLRRPADANPTINVLFTVVRDIVSGSCYFLTSRNAEIRTERH